MVQIGFSLVDVFQKSSQFIQDIVNYIVSLIEFLSSLISAISILFVSFFVGLPSFISTGLLSVFSIGMTILIIKLVRS